MTGAPKKTQRVAKVHGETRNVKSPSPNTTRTPRLAILCAFALGISGLTTCRASDLNEETAASRHVLESCVRVTIFPYSASDHVIERDIAFGFGVRIAPGLVLTASHVCFPYADQCSDADYYELQIEAWDGVAGNWSKSCTFSSHALRPLVLVHAGNLSTNSSLPRLKYDSKQQVPRKLDYALIRTPTNSQPFLDTVGMYMPLDSEARKKRKWDLFCTSDFSRRKEPELTHHHVGERNPFPNHGFEMEIKDVEIKGGSSGSPIVLVSESSPASAFVAGIVVRGELDPGAPRNFSALFMQEILTDIPLPDLTKSLEPAATMPCPWPSPRPLLDGLVTGFNNATSEDTRKAIAHCFYSISTWEGTGAALDAYDNVIPILQSKVSDLSGLSADVAKAGYQLDVAEATLKRHTEIRRLETEKANLPFGPVLLKPHWVTLQVPPSQADREAVAEARNHYEDKLRKYELVVSQARVPLDNSLRLTYLPQTSAENREPGVTAAFNAAFLPVAPTGLRVVAAQ